jgi:hypothetical protein
MMALCAGWPAAAEPESEPAAATGVVPLDQLLRLPAGSGRGSQIERRGGHTRAEWETRFQKARAAQDDADSAIARTRAAIEERVAKDGGGAWRIGAPGLGNLTAAQDPVASPLDYKLTQTLRRNREELARADRELQDLGIEANLASVPVAWRRAPSDEQAAP